MPRGRTRTVTSEVAPLIPGARPPPPDQLDEDQARIWDQIVTPLPQGWFGPETYPLLVQLCRHVNFADELSRDIAATRSEISALASEASPEAREPSPDARKALALLQRRLLALMRAHGAQSASAASLATKLRLTKKSRYMRDAELAAIGSRNSSSIPEPWNDWKNDREQ